LLTFIMLNSSQASISNLGIFHIIRQNRSIALILLVIIIIYLIIITVILWNEVNKRRLWSTTGVYRKREKLSDQFFMRAYRTLKAFPLTRDYIDKLSYQFRLISPCDSKTIARKSVTICLLLGIVSILVFFFLFLLNPRLISLIISGVTIIILNYEIVGRMAKSFERKLMTDMQHFIEHEIHNYYVNYRVDDAIYLSLDSLSPNMRVVANQIYQLLLSDDREYELKVFYENVPNKYLREFVSLCVGVAERGDEEVNGKHMFVRNMENLYTQLEIEIEKLQRLNMEFMGVMFIVLLPLFSIDLVKWFCITLKKTLESFYYGKAGFLTDIGIVTVTAAIYVVMRKSAEYIPFRQSSHKWLYALERIAIIKRALDNYCDKNASGMERLRRELKYNGYNIKPRHFIMRSYLLAISMFFVGLGIIYYLNDRNKQDLLQVDTAYVEELTSASNKTQYEKMAEIIKNYTGRYVSGDAIPQSTEELVKILESDKDSFYNKLINEALAKEIIKRVNQYYALRLTFYDILACVALGVIAYFLPLLMLKYNAAASRDAMEDEINQFNALIGMLMYNRSITVRQILIELESYAVVFKQSIRSCINDFSSGDIDALRKLKEEEPYGPFGRIVDNLSRCDDMPIYEAFHEVDVEREGYLSKRKLANEKSIRKRVIRAYLLAAIPLLLLFLYGVIPTLQVSMKEITDTLNALDSSW
jgi:hypothetical protein